MNARHSALHSLRRTFSADALWITSLPHIRWACGFTGSNGLLLVLNDAVHFLSDGRYAAQAQQEVHDAHVHAHDYDLIGAAIDEQLLIECKTIAYDSDALSVAQLEDLEKRIPWVQWKGEKELLAQLVASKDELEIQRISAAQMLTEEVFAEMLNWIHPGQTEKEISAEIVYRHLRCGADGMSFPPIVASGPNSALPHARPTSRPIQLGDVLLLDFGCHLDGYASDMTRTIAVGRPASDVRSVYDVVLSAQKRAIDGARAGIPSKALDALARDVIKQSGYGEHFAHSLGHGVGLQVHEWPRVSYIADYDLPRNAVVSIEPGIYLPGKFGVRIEDLIVLRDDGADVLTRSSKAWTVV